MIRREDGASLMAGLIRVFVQARSNACFLGFIGQVGPTPLHEGFLLLPKDQGTPSCARSRFYDHWDYHLWVSLKISISLGKTYRVGFRPLPRLVFCKISFWQRFLSREWAVLGGIFV